MRTALDRPRPCRSCDCVQTISRRESLQDQGWYVAQWCGSRCTRLSTVVLVRWRQRATLILAFSGLYMCVSPSAPTWPRSVDRPSAHVAGPDQHAAHYDYPSVRTSPGQEARGRAADPARQAYRTQRCNYGFMQLGIRGSLPFCVFSLWPRPAPSGKLDSRNSLALLSPSAACADAPAQV